MLFKVHSTPLKTITYSSPLFSIATLLLLALYIAIILLPLVFAYASNDFWNKESNYREQPLVYVSNSNLILLEGLDAGVPFAVNYASDALYQRYLGQTSRVLSVKVFNNAVG